MSARMSDDLHTHPYSSGGGADAGKWSDNKEWVGDAVEVACEEDIFAALGLRYLPPAKRTGQVQHLPLVSRRHRLTYTYEAGGYGCVWI